MHCAKRLGGSRKNRALASFETLLRRQHPTMEAVLTREGLTLGVVLPGAAEEPILESSAVDGRLLLLPSSFIGDSSLQTDAEDVEYVPVSAAKEALAAMQERFQKLKRSHVEILQQLEDAYAEKERHAAAYYEEFARGVQAKAARQLESHRQSLKQKDTEAERLRQQVESQQKQLRRKADEYKSALDAHLREMERLRRQHLRDTEAQRAIFLADMEELGRRFDGDSQVRRVCEAVMVDLCATVEAVEQEEARLRAKALNTVAKAQTSELEALRSVVESQAQENDSRRRQLLQVRRVLHDTETDVVGAVLESMVAAVERDMTSAELRTRLEKAAAKVAEAQEGKRLAERARIAAEEQEKAAADALSGNEEMLRLVPELPSLVEKRKELEELHAKKKSIKQGIKEWIRDFEQREGREATNDDKLLIKDQFVQHKAVDKEMKALRSEIEELSRGQGAISPEEGLSTTPRMSTLVTPKAERDRPEESTDTLKQEIVRLQAQVGDLRGQLTRSKGPAGGGAGETAAEQQQERLKTLESLNDQVREATAELEQLTSKKKKVKQEIKEWLADFEAREGREATNDDKAAIMDKFVAHKAIDKQVKAMKQELQDKEDALSAARAATPAAALGIAGDPSRATGASQDILADLARAREEAASLREKRSELETRVSELDANLAKLDALHAEELRALKPENQPSAQEVTELRANAAALEAHKAATEAHMNELQQRADQTASELVAATEARRQAETVRDKALRARTEAEEAVAKMREELLATQASLAAQDASGELGRLQQEILRVQADLSKKARAATAGWDAAADAEERLEQEVEDARKEAFQQGREQGTAEATMKAGAMLQAMEAKLISMKEAVTGAMAEVQSARSQESDLRAKLLALQRQLKGATAAPGAKPGGPQPQQQQEPRTEEAREAREEQEQKQSREDQERQEARETELRALREQLSQAKKEAEAAAEAETEPAPADLNRRRTTLRAPVQTVRGYVREGTDLWRNGKRDECFDLYDRAAVEVLPTLDDASTSDLHEQLVSALRLARRESKARGAVTLRKSFNAILQGRNASPSPPPKRSTLRQGEEVARLEAKIRQLETTYEEDEEDESDDESDDGGEANGANEANGGADVRRLQAEKRELAAKVRRLERDLEDAASSGGAGGAAAGGAGGDRAMQRRFDMLEKKHKRAMEDIAKRQKKEADMQARRLGKAEKQNADLSDELRTAVSERDELKGRLKALGSVEKELVELRDASQEAARLQRELQESVSAQEQLQKQYQEEKTLRRRYWNMMEDMKGKIRVYARCRPFAQYEMERGARQVITFVDETTLGIETSRGPKEFTFDSVFPPHINQEEVFEECSSLMQSALDGFNVCCFAYGQTGSGKTFTMTGSPGTPHAGLTPRMVEECYKLIRENSDKFRVSVSCYFTELYNDSLRDLFWALEHKSREAPPKLEIKVNHRNMVFVKNAIVKSVESPDELLELFNRGNSNRAVASTNMNATSSRSHSIFSILLESYDLTTQKTTVGKLTLVDLAGSERADKTGATGDRIREAQSINKSLSALGDVISALSTGESFIPYRNNKLTQLMQDSLGGNAKTLMFVNLSPADYNQEETLTSLLYASRVKQITNNAKKNEDSAEVARLREIIRQLKEGRQVDEEDAPAATAAAEESKS
eukprot:scaffold2329_cov247-Pinguiococcus_pyrenoidosus.AAC.5